jgi:rhodanese-related sulfurtransferase
MGKIQSTGMLLSAVVVAALWLTACSSQPVVGMPIADVATNQQTSRVAVEDLGSYTDVSVTGLAAILQKKDFPLINVHIPYEGEIEPTDLFIPYDEIERHLDQLPTDKSDRIVLYCRSDRMSGIAARTLVKLGYTDVWNLDGGMTAWEAAGYPILEKEEP